MQKSNRGIRIPQAGVPGGAADASIFGAL